METKQLENSIEEEHNENDIDSLDETKSCERNESLFGLTRDKICESCENFEKFTPLGQWVRRCQACARRKNILEKKPCHEELGREERLEMDYDVQDEPMVVATTKFVPQMNTKLEENWNDSLKDSNNESFAVKHEHVDLLGSNVIKVPNITNNEDVKALSKKKENMLLNKKEYKILNASEPILKKEKIGYSRGRFILDKDMIVSNEKKEQTIEILDAQKTKEEIELERRERGWIVNGSVISKSTSHPKVSPIKNVVTIDGYSPGKEERERIKVRNLKEKPDTQRILGLVAKRSESRISSPTHRISNPNFKRNEDIEVPYTINMNHDVVPSITLHEKNLESSKPQEIHDKITKNNESGLIPNENKKKSFHTSIEEVAKLQSHTPQQDSKEKCSSPTSLGNYTNENILFGTQRILELLAKRNGSRVTSPKQSREISAHESESNNISYDKLIQQNQTKKSDVLFHSSKLYDQQQENSLMKVILPRITTNTYNEHNIIQKNSNEKKLNINHEIGSSAQINKAQEELEHNSTSLTNPSCHCNDNQFYNTNQVLELISKRSENNITSPQKCTYYNTKDESLSNAKENGYLKPNIIKLTNEIIPSCSKENQEVTSPKVTHLTLTLHNHNINYKRNEGKISIHI